MEDKVNLNEFAAEIAKEEGGKEEVNIAQIKEVLSIILRKLSRLSTESLQEVLSRYKKDTVNNQE